MKRPNLVSNKLLALSLTIIGGSGCVARPVHDDPNETNQISETNAYVSELKDSHWSRMHRPWVDAQIQPIIDSGEAPGCAVGIVEGGEVTYLSTYGKQRAGGPNWTFDTVAPLASISKTYTALAIMRLRDAGLLSLNDLVGDHLPIDSQSVDVGILQIKDLLSHATGLPRATDLDSYVGCPGYPNADADWCETQPAITFDRYKRLHSPEAPEPVELPNGSTYAKGEYSNVAFMILGAIVDRVTRDSPQIPADQKGYEAYVWYTIAKHKGNKADIREQHSMALSSADRRPEFAAYADGHCPSNDCDVWENGHRYGPAGLWTSTIGDLTRFVQTKINRGIVSSSSWADMATPRTNVLGSSFMEDTEDYGLGMFTEDVGNQGTYQWHGGAGSGHGSVWLTRTPVNSGSSLDEIGVAILCNGAMSTNLWWLARNIAVGTGLSTPAVLRKTPSRITTLQKQRLHGNKYSMNAQTSRLTSHRNLFLPLATAGTWGFEMRYSGGQLRATAHGMRASNASSSQTTVDLGTMLSIDQHHVRSSSKSIIFSSQVGNIELRNARFTFGFNQNRKRLTDAKLTGSLDMRQASLVPNGPSWQQMCLTSHIEDNTPCSRCPDGQYACLNVTWDRLGGVKVNSL